MTEYLHFSVHLMLRFQHSAFGALGAEAAKVLLGRSAVTYVTTTSPRRRFCEGRNCGNREALHHASED